MLVTLAQKARSAQSHRTQVDHLDHPFLHDRTGRLQKKRRQHEGGHDQPAGKTELVDTEERALELSNDAIDRDLLGGLPEARAHLPSSFESYFLHGSNRNAPSSGLKYFMRLAAIGAAYGLFLASPIRESTSRRSLTAHRAPGRFLEGKMTLERFHCYTEFTL